MDKISGLVDVCQFEKARQLLQKEYENIEDTKKGWKLQMFSLYLNIKEKEHKISIQEKDLRNSIESFLDLLSQIQGMAENTRENFITELSCCTNIVSLVNCTEQTCCLDELVLKRICGCLSKGIKLYWNETSSLPPHSFESSNEEGGSSSSHVLINVLSFYDRIISTLQDLKLLGIFCSLLTALSLNGLIIGKFGRLQETISNLLNLCVKQFERLLKIQIVKPRNPSQLVFLDMKFPDFQRYVSIINGLKTTFAKNVPCRFGNTQPGIEPIGNEPEDFNPLLFIISNLHLLWNKKYEECLHYLQQVESSTLLLSRLSIFQCFQFTNIRRIASSILNNDAASCAATGDNFLTPVYKMIHLLNQTAFCLHNNDSENAIKSLESLSRMTSKDVKEEPVYLVTNLEYRLEKRLKELLLEKFPYVMHCDIKYFLYIEEYPELYILDTLSRQLHETGRFNNASKIFKKLITRLDEKDSNNLFSSTSLESAVDMEIVHQQCCLCYLKCHNDEKALELIIQFKRKGLSSSWMFLYEGEVYRRQFQFEKCVSTWKRAMDVFEDGLSTSELKEDESNRKSMKYHKAHFLNNLGVVYMQMHKKEDAFNCIKEGIQYCQRVETPIPKELVYNYCKWLSHHKSRDLALMNWRHFYRSDASSVSSPSFQKEFLVSI